MGLLWLFSVFQVAGG
nr:core protein [Simian pegivirus]